MAQEHTESNIRLNKLLDRMKGDIKDKQSSTSTPGKGSPEDTRETDLEKGPSDKDQPKSGSLVQKILHPRK